MIDKTDKKIDLLLHSIINQIKLYLGILKKWHLKIRAFTNEHKIGTRIVVTGLVLLVITGLALYRYIPREVTLIVDDSRTICETSPSTQARTVEDFLKEREIELIPADEVNQKMDEKIKSGMVIKVTKAFSLPIEVDDKTITINTTSCSAVKAIKKANIKLKEDDIVVGGRGHVVKNGEKIVIKRVVIKYKKKKVDLPYDTTTVNTERLRIGKVEVLTSGKTGKATKYYKYIYVDDKLYRVKVYKKVVHKKPRTKVVGYGTRISFDGPPSGLSYRKKIQVKAVAYNFSGNPIGSGGRPCTYGTMAVDPRVIPMGTRCYVDGYGYAIANDVGTGVKGNIVDLYMEAYFQSVMWGAHYTTVYILD